MNIFAIAGLALGVAGTIRNLPDVLYSDGALNMNRLVSAIICVAIAAYSARRIQA